MLVAVLGEQSRNAEQLWQILHSAALSVGEQKGQISSFESNRSSMWSHASGCAGELFSSWTKADGKCGSGPLASAG